jgi:hypothetical protein
MRKLVSRIILAVVLGIPGLAAGYGEALDEYQVKAAFLYNFAKFVEWPPQTFKSADEPISVCVLGRNPFDSALEDALKGRELAGRKFVARELSDTSKAKDCHVLFFGSSEKKRTRTILDELSGKSVLTVGETDDFLSNGGVITFRLRDARVRFEIDLGMAERARLKISSKLLSLSDTAKKAEVQK